MSSVENGTTSRMVPPGEILAEEKDTIAVRLSFFICIEPEFHCMLPPTARLSEPLGVPGDQRKAEEPLVKIAAGSNVLVTYHSEGGSAMSMKPPAGIAPVAVKATAACVITPGVLLAVFTNFAPVTAPTVIAFTGRALCPSIFTPVPVLVKMTAEPAFLTAAGVFRLVTVNWTCSSASIAPPPVVITTSRFVSSHVAVPVTSLGSVKRPAAPEDDKMEGFHKVLDALHSDFDYVHRHSTLFLRAQDWLAHARDPG